MNKTMGVVMLLLTVIFGQQKKAPQHLNPVEGRQSHGYLMKCETNLRLKLALYPILIKLSLQLEEATSQSWRYCG